MLPRPIVLVLLALGLLFAIDLFALAAYRELEQASERVDLHIQATAGLRELQDMMRDMQSGMQGYVLTGSLASLSRYRTAANQFAARADDALARLDEGAKQRKLAESAVASAKDWLARYASPLVVKRSAGGQASAATLLETLRRSGAEKQTERIRAQFQDALQIQRERLASAQLDQGQKLQNVFTWMRGRALALLLSLAALTLMLGRTLAKLTGQMRSREAAENAMRTSSATLRAMSDASPLGMFLADRSGGCVQSNASFERITGLSEDAVLGKGWQATLHPDDRERVVAAWDAATAAHAPFVSIHRFVHRNGKVVWASMKSASMSDAGQLIGFACSIEDVSERREAEVALRQSEERLHMALESSRLALFDWHIPSGEIFLSREWGYLTGHGSQPVTTTARRLTDMIHPGDMDALRETIISAFKTNKPLSRREFRIETRPGQWKRVFCSGRVTERNAAGRAVRLTGTITAD